MLPPACSPPLPPQVSQSLALSIDAFYQTRELFLSNLKFLLNITGDRLVIASIVPGSINVNLMLLPDPTIPVPDITTPDPVAAGGLDSSSQSDIQAVIAALPPDQAAAYVSQQQAAQVAAAAADPSTTPAPAPAASPSPSAAVVVDPTASLIALTLDVLKVLSDPGASASLGVPLLGAPKVADSGSSGSMIVDPAILAAISAAVVAQNANAPPTTTPATTPATTPTTTTPAAPSPGAGPAGPAPAPAVVPGAAPKDSGVPVLPVALGAAIGGVVLLGIAAAGFIYAQRVKSARAVATDGIPMTPPAGKKGAFRSSFTNMVEQMSTPASPMAPGSRGASGTNLGSAVRGPGGAFAATNPAYESPALRSKQANPRDDGDLEKLEWEDEEELSPLGGRGGNRLGVGRAPPLDVSGTTPRMSNAGNSTLLAGRMPCSPAEELIYRASNTGVGGVSSGLNSPALPIYRASNPGPSLFGNMLAVGIDSPLRSAGGSPLPGGGPHHQQQRASDAHAASSRTPPRLQHSDSQTSRGSQDGRRTSRNFREAHPPPITVPALGGSAAVMTSGAAAVHITDLQTSPRSPFPPGAEHSAEHLNHANPNHHGGSRPGSARKSNVASPQLPIDNLPHPVRRTLAPLASQDGSGLVGVRPNSPIAPLPLRSTVPRIAAEQGATMSLPGGVGEVAVPTGMLRSAAASAAVAAGAIGRAHV